MAIESELEVRHDILSLTQLGLSLNRIIARFNRRVEAVIAV
jgi:hypothetical protein